MRLTSICHITLMSAALAAPRPQWLALPSESRNICARAADLLPSEPQPRRQLDAPEPRPRRQLDSLGCVDFVPDGESKWYAAVANASTRIDCDFFESFITAANRGSPWRPYCMRWPA